MKDLLLQNRQFLIYCLIGMSGTVLDFAVYTCLIKLKVFDYQPANAISYASGTLLSFALNARFNFCITDKMARRLACFFGVAVIGWTVSALLLHLLVGVWSLNKYISKLGTLMVVVIVQYNLNRRFSFRKIN